MSAPIPRPIPTWRDASVGGPSPSDHSTGERAAPGALIGQRYELIAPIGHGGMGTVWQAADTLLRRDVAVKEVILPLTMPRHERDALYERTLREARAAAALSHPSVVQVYDVVTDDARPWIVMELLEARSLADIVIEDGPLRPRTVAKIGIAMLGALEVAHAAGVLHRDVKPANVLICPDGRCVLTDFGVARLPTESKLTTPGMVLGSPHFISPERAVGGSFGPPSDLFSLGVTLYTAVEGGPPFDRGDPFETMRAVVEEPPRAARLAGPLEPVLWGLLDKDPTRRWSVDRARAVLRELLAGPLSSSAQAHGRHDTDPNAVMRQAMGPPPAIRNGGQVGGRAMLDPREPLTGQLARLRGPSSPPMSPPLSPPLGPPPGPPDGSANGSTGAPLWGGSTGGSPYAGPPHREQGPPPWEQGPPPHREQGPPSWEQPPPLWRHSPSAWDQQADYPLFDDDDLSSSRRDTAGHRRETPSVLGLMLYRLRELGTGRQGTGGRVLVMLGGALAAITGIVLIVLLNGTNPPLNTGPGPSLPGSPDATAPVSPAASDQPLIPVQEYRDRGIVVNVPAGWTKVATSSYVDFTDPAGGRKVRINVEHRPATTTATKFLQGAESGLKNPSRCPAPYQRVNLTETELAGRPAGELEYTCGTDSGMRHGIWRALVVEGTVYHFYLTVPDTDFASSRVIYEEMVRSFGLTDV